VNFGGGFGVQYRDYVQHPLLPQESEHREHSVTTVKLIQSVLPLLQQLNALILIQPGRSVIAHAGVMLAKVLYRKQTGQKTFLILDAGMNDLLRPSLYQSYHQIVPLKVQGVPKETVDIVGPLCESGDYLALDRAMPVMGRGEYLSVMCTGAYGFVLSSNYNGRPRPAEVLVDGDTYSVVTRREHYDDIYAKGGTKG
jgi:diaminopimelate decarboxylase